ncbi:hypothetical protein, partial [Bifidobacterium pullorum]|uniref:hypothetical protein n=1 Tax=Bifidobacterium pullorum TaxID=78448 RepID=UPI00307C2E65
MEHEDLQYIARWVLDESVDIRIDDGLFKTDRLRIAVQPENESRFPADVVSRPPRIQLVSATLVLGLVVLD